MIRSRLGSWCRVLLGERTRKASDPGRRARTKLELEALEARDLLASFTMPIVNQTGLKQTDYAIYAMGMSYGSQLVLQSNGTFATQSSGTITSYKVGTEAGQLSQITFDANTAFTSGRLYFFVVPLPAAAPPSVPYGQQPANPPGNPFPFSIVEINVPGGGANATIDVQTVDGFIFPLAITLNNNFNVPGQQYGQPVYNTGQTPTVNRVDIFTAYNSFMQAQGAAGQPYAPLTFSPNSVAGQAGGILNPGLYLNQANAQNELLHLNSPLNTAWNADLNTLFSTTTLSIQGVASAPSDSGPAIPADIYTVTSTGNQTYPGTTASLPALQFTGMNAGNVFHVFNPVGTTVTTDTGGGEIRGSINGTILTLNSDVNGLMPGMFVLGAGTNPAATQIAAGGVNGRIITLNQNLGQPAPNAQYRFSWIPNLFDTPGMMVLNNSGVFADNAVQFASGSSQATVLGNLENQLASALNRGVAVVPGALNPGAPGGTSAIWGTQTNWYPAGRTQNLFSLFMHTGQIGGIPIFVQPANAAAFPNAQGTVMGSAYGFAFDENGGPVPPAAVGQPEVPSKFDQNVPAGATITITLGPWFPQAPLPGGATRYFAVGSGPGAASSVKVYRVPHALVKTFSPFGPAFRAGVRVATGDVTGDGIEDVIVAQGPTALALARRGGSTLSTTLVKVYDGSTFRVVHRFRAFPQRGAQQLHLGVFVASGDVNNDGFADIVVGADAGWRPQVRVYSGKDGGLLRQFRAFGPNFTFGVRVAVGDFDKDGFADIVAGAGLGSLVKIFDGRTYQLNRGLNAYPGAGNNLLGVFVAVGDVQGDSNLEVITGTGPRFTADARVFVAHTGELLDQVFRDPQLLAGIPMGVFDVDGDGKSEVLVGRTPSESSIVDVWRFNAALDRWLRTDIFSPFGSDATTGNFVG